MKKRIDDKAWRSLRVYSLAEFEKFKDICHSEYSNPQIELNKFIRRVVEAGTLKEVKWH